MSSTNMTITLGRVAGAAAKACANGKTKSERRVMAVADMTYLDIAVVGLRSRAFVSKSGIREEFSQDEIRSQLFKDQRKS